MKMQIFLDGNKRAAIIFANHYLISHGGGLLVIPEKDISKFKNLLMKYYDENNETALFEFMKKNCWSSM